MTEEQFAITLDADPFPDEIKQNEDGSLYLPISIVQNKMDKIFGHGWNWDFDRETIDKTEAIGKGRVWYIHPVTKDVITRPGTAGIVIEGPKRLWYPRLEAMSFLNASKKIGRCFGRDLNRNIDDAPTSIPVFKSEKDTEIDNEFKNLKEQIVQCKCKEQAEVLLKESSFKFNMELKAIVDMLPPFSEIRDKAEADLKSKFTKLK